ncbi:Na+/H+ antiporter NhaA [Anaerobiospirillum sp. NML120448]|uniref:Na+/H+ antiporter NhaA n=1 Tax=Anaerobiospirillum sp. NML120448 TaxID=2932816 RepID=UPI001FF5D11A|nr:Na+/H+ antiporter NhaA [Anaerobiospirillum sp. NML120448]
MRVLSDLRVRLPRTVAKFTHNDATGGIIMMACIVLALILQNGSYSTSYRHGIEMSAGVVFGDFQLIKPLLLWINDGLITVFFFSIGLQLKIEFVKGNLSNPRNIILPALAAMGGILVPSLIFTLFNHGNEFAMRGWAIPTSTDTAFSVAILLLLGSRVPASLKILLLSTSVFDDMGAMMILAVFYTTDLSTSALSLAGVAVLGLVLLNYFGVGRKSLYIILGLILWFFILKSGVHPTLAGIITAFSIPMKSAYGELMVEPISDSLKVWVSLFVLPLFTLANAGIDLSMIDITGFFVPISLGIFFALTVGKPLGVFLVIWLAIKVRLVKQPSDANFVQIYGMCILTGIGFSMAFFYDSLAYEGSSVFEYADALAILVASFVSGVYGYLFLRFVACRTAAIEYRPWLPSPFGYKGTARTANLYTLDKSTQGPSSVAPTAALVAEANARAAAAAAAAKAADEAAAAAKQAAEAAKQAAELEEEASDETIAKVQLAAAQAAKAAASAAVSTAKLDESEDVDTAEVAKAALEAASAATQVAQEVVDEMEKEEYSDQEEAENEGSNDQSQSKSSEDKASAKSSAATKNSAKSNEDNLDDTEPEADRKTAKKAKDEEETSTESDKKSGITSVATKAIAKVVSSIIPEKDEEAKENKESKSDKSDKAEPADAKSEKETKAPKKAVTALRADGKEEVHELEDDGPKTVIAVDSVGFAKVQPLVEEPKEEIEPLSAHSIAPEEVAEHERLIKGESNTHKSVAPGASAANTSSSAKTSASTASSASAASTASASDVQEQVTAQDQANSAVSGSDNEPSHGEVALDTTSESQETAKAKQDQSLKTKDTDANADTDATTDANASAEAKTEHLEDTANKVSGDKKAEKKAKAKSNADFDSDIYLTEVVGSVVAQVEKIAEEKAKAKKTVNVAELIAKAKNIEEAIHREAEKSSKAEKADKHEDATPAAPETPAQATPEPATDQAQVATPDKDSSLEPKSTQEGAETQNAQPSTEGLDAPLSADDYQSNQEQKPANTSKEAHEHIDPLLVSDITKDSDTKVLKEPLPTEPKAEPNLDLPQTPSPETTADANATVTAQAQDPEQAQALAQSQEQGQAQADAVEAKLESEAHSEAISSNKAGTKSDDLLAANFDAELAKQEKIKEELKSKEKDHSDIAPLTISEISNQTSEESSEVKHSDSQGSQAEPTQQVSAQQEGGVLKKLGTLIGKRHH